MVSKLKEVFDGVEKWKVALAVATPIAVGLAGWWYIKRSRKQANSSVIGDDVGSLLAENTLKQSSKQDNQKAQEAKNHGNKCFKEGKYDAAIQYYTEAIEICPSEYKSEIATFHQNRAAAYDHLKNYQKVIADCDVAITLNPRYSKAFHRRAKAHEQRGQLMEALMDLTALCILDSFKNPANLQLADRVLKELGKTQAKEAFKNRVPSNPSKHFIRNYYNGFANDPVIKWTPSTENFADVVKDTIIEDVKLDKNELHINENEKENENSNNNQENDEKYEDKDILEILETSTEEKIYKLRPFHKARENLLREDYNDIISLCSEEIDLPDSSDTAPALLLRGTFFLLRGEYEKAKEDLDKIIENEAVDKRIRVNALIKRGSLLMQKEKQTDSLDDFATAVRIDPENCDVYHHRGQTNLLLDRMKDAQLDFDRSIQLNPQHAISHVQKIYSEYRDATMRQNPVQLQTAVKNFADVIKRFPDCPDGHMLFAQALADSMRYEDADKHFEKALKIDPGNAQIIVHRALLHLQWKENLKEACNMIKEAIRVDPKCEFAYETLATLKVQMSDLSAALELFDKAIEICKSETELAHIFSLKNAAISQMTVARNLGIDLPNIA